jgi:membrane fusion protein, adhesin transport system
MNNSPDNTDIPPIKKPPEKSWFKTLGIWLDKFSIPASRYIDAAYTRWLAPLKDKQDDWVTDADWAKLQQEPVRSRALLRIIAISIVVLLCWAALANLDEVTRGEGKVIPSSQLQVVQSVDGGVVQEILVQEGQVVNKGDALVRIDSTRFLANYREGFAEYIGLRARAVRLDALIHAKEFVLPEDLETQAPDIVTHERNLFEALRNELTEQTSIATSQLNQRQEELNEVRAKLKQSIQALELTTHELAVTKPLLASGAISEVEILKLEGQVSEAKSAREQATAQEARLVLAVDESESKLREITISASNKWSTELSEVLSRISMLQEGNAGLADRVKYAEVRSPVRGAVQRVFTNTIGGVVQPGAKVVEIVSLDDQLIVEAKVAPKDIAFLHPGQPAIVKFTAYDFVIYGGLKGVVEHVSADTVTDEKERTFYIVRVRTDRTGFNANLPIIPGMVTQVDIITGKKSVLAYMLKPVLRAKANALTER